MKNWKIGTKLIGGFCISALIIFVVGVTSIKEQNNLYSLQEKLATEDLRALEQILTIKAVTADIAGYMRTLLTPYATKEQRQEVNNQLLKGRQQYGEAKKKFLDLAVSKTVEKEMDEFGVHISKWAAANNTVVQTSDKLIEIDIVNPSALNDKINLFIIGHHELISKVGNLVTAGKQFEGGTDANQCALGQWLNNLDTTNKDLHTYAEQLKPIHQKFHDSVGELKNAVEDNRTYAANTILTATIFPVSKEIFTILDEVKEISSSAYKDFTNMTTTLLGEAAEHQQNTFNAIDRIVEKVVQGANQTVEQGEKIAQKGLMITIAGIVIGVVLALVLGFYLTIIITRPLSKGVELSRAMAEGDMTQSLDIDQKDEIGILAKALNEMARSLREIIKDINTGVVNVDSSANQLAAISNQMTAGAEETSSRSNQVATASEEMSANQNSIATAMEQATTNLNMVATAAEEMSATITEIAQNSTKAKDITNSAVTQSQKASDQIDELGKAADEINRVTEVITEISDQTNLLALNATIEAARAGEAGKGFAVVANEIKDLAKQTAEATLDIKTKIQGIQSATDITVKEINQISKVIGDVDKIVETIAVAVEEQTATTREIAENVSQASVGVNEVNENVAQSSTVAEQIATDINSVSKNAQDMNDASAQVNDSAGTLSTTASSLKNMIEKFTV